jgi:Spy/CpxP family protein refolding chaperone
MGCVPSRTVRQYLSRGGFTLIYVKVKFNLLPLFNLESRGKQTMKSTWIKPIGAAVLAAGMAFAYAETPANPAPATTEHQHRFNRQEWMQRRFDRLSAYLNLTDQQKTQAQAIRKDAHESAKKFAPQLKQNREALKAAIKEGKPESEIARISNEQGRLMGRMIAIRTEAFAKIYQTLTPEQKAKADQMPEHFRNMRHEHTQNRRQG